MMNAVIDGMVAKLLETFGEDTMIYTEEVKQGMKEPCFFVFSVNPIHRQVRGELYHRNQLFSIHYYSGQEEKQQDNNRIAEHLFWAMEYIDVAGDLTRGTQMELEESGGALHFLVRYDMFFIRKKAQEPPMEELLIEQEAKG